jgi:hypothetical protein
MFLHFRLAVYPFDAHQLERVVDFDDVVEAEFVDPASLDIGG